jgi:hypothetical protein
MAFEMALTARPSIKIVLLAKLIDPVPAEVLLYKPNVPADTVVPPVKVLAAVKFKRPVPDLVSVALVPAITPAYADVPDWVMVRARPLARLMSPFPLKPDVLIEMLPVVVLVVARLLLRVTLPPNSVIGPAMLVEDPMVMFPVLLAWPIVKPEIPAE